ncbi:Flagellar hook-basal body complex protein FliE [Candidatus Magnetomoraceae bacterium gMMP-15]
MNDLKVQNEAIPVFPERDNHFESQVNFRDFIRDAIYKTNQRELDANESTEKLMQGETGIHETMIAHSKADISMRLLLQFRNKAMESYKEVMRMSF